VTTPTQLDDRIAAAWAAYRAATQDMAGQDYADAEELAWTLLQADLHEIGLERAGLTAGAAAH
jgi:hypothetical protein